MNVFVILGDSWRPDFLGCYGNDWISTPELDDFADDANLFTQAYSENMPTLPARQSLFTGRFGLPFRRWQALDVKSTVLAEKLWNEGFKTFMVGDTFPMFDPKWGGRSYGRGFEEVSWIRGQGMESEIIDRPAEKEVDNYLKGDDSDDSKQIRREIANYLGIRRGWDDDSEHFSARVVQRSIELLETNYRNEPNRDLFFWMDIFDPHEPWDPVEPYDTMYGDLLPGDNRIIQPVGRPTEGYLTEEEEEHVRNQYAGLCTITDKWIGKFLDYLRDRGLYEDSLIVFLSDHGEPLGRGKWGHGIMRKCRPWPYEELAHIPLIVRHPDREKGQEINSMVQTCDVPATILDYLNLSPLEGMHGKSTLPLIEGNQEELRDFAIAGYHGTSWSIRTDDWSYILWRPEADRSQLPSSSLGAIRCIRGGTLDTPVSPELYDRRSDPYEQNNVINDNIAIANELDLKLRRFLERLKWE